MISMFFGCSGLTTLDGSGFDTGNVIDMRGMFDDCDGLILLDVSGFDTKNVIDLSGMFCGCTGLRTLDLSSFSLASWDFKAWYTFIVTTTVVYPIDDPKWASLMEENPKLR